MAPSPRIPGPLLLPPLSSLTLSSLRCVSWRHVHTFAAEPGERLGGLQSVQSPEPARDLVPTGENQARLHLQRIIVSSIAASASGRPA